MTMIRRKPDAMPPFFDSYLLRDTLERPAVNTKNGSTSFPAINIKETPQGFELVLVAPGMNKGDFSIEVEEDLLTIASVEKEMKAEEADEKFHVREFVPRSFKRSFKLAENKINVEKIEADYTNGILKLSLPKKVEQKQEPKRIKVS